MQAGIGTKRMLRAAALGLGLTVGLAGVARAQETLTPVARVSTGMVSLAGGQIARLSVNEAGFNPTPTLVVKLALIDDHGVRLAERETTLDGGASVSLVYTRPSTSGRIVLRGLIETRGPFTPSLANARLVATLELTSGPGQPPWSDLAVSCPYGVLPSGAAPTGSGPFEPMCPPPCALDLTYE